CDLAEDECMWLDPHWGELAPDWGQRRETGVWITSVSADAANWVNRELHDNLNVGDDEHREWRKEIETLLREMEE
ncbi:MAG: hypothetical protein K2H64_03510, partial [Desulfovibrio sp.]|nr:hypothetical protein [Desulfovibrio sp.]